MVFEFLVRVGDCVMCLVITAQRTVYCILHQMQTSRRSYLEEKGQFKLKAAYPHASGAFFLYRDFFELEWNQHFDCSLSFVHQIGFSPKRNDAALNVS